VTESGPSAPARTTLERLPVLPGDGGAAAKLQALVLGKGFMPDGNAVQHRGDVGDLAERSPAPVLQRGRGPQQARTGAGRGTLCFSLS